MKIVLKHILRNIREKKGRTFLIVLALTIASMVFTLNLILPDEIMVKLKETYNTIYGSTDIVISDEEEFDIRNIDLGSEEIVHTRILSLDAVRGDTASLIYSLDMDEARKIGLLGGDVPDLGKNELCVSERQSQVYDLKIGDTVTITYEDKEYVFTIAAIVGNKGLNAIDEGCPSFVGRLEDVAAIKGCDEFAANSLFINVIDDDSVEDYTEYLSEHNKDYGIQRVANPDDYKDSMAFVSAIMVLVFAMAIIMIVYVIGSLNKIIITERLPVIGTFRSIGATKHKMNGILVLENALYGLIGGVIGVFGGYLLNEKVAKIFITTNGVELSDKNTAISVPIVLAVVFFAVLLQVIVSVKAIVKANKKGIKDLIFDLQSSRYRVMTHRTVIGLILVVASVVANMILKDTNMILTIIIVVVFITGVALLVPHILQLVSALLSKLARKCGWNSAFIACRNLGYNKMIVSSSRVVVVSLSLMLAIVSISGAVKDLFQSFRIVTEGYDMIISNVTGEEQEYEKLTEIEEITSVSYGHFYWDNVTYNGGKNLNQRPAFVGVKEDIPYIKEYNYQMEYLKADEMLIDEIYAEKNGLEIGDKVKFYLESLNKELEYTIVGTVNSTYFSTARNAILVNYDHYIKEITKVPAQIYLTVKDGTDIDALKKEINLVLKERRIYIQTNEEYIDEQEASVGQVLSLFYIVIGLAVALSFVGIVNNQIIGFVQRRKEIAVLYSTSMSKGQLRKMLFFETFFSNLIASAIAVLASILTTGMLESVMKGMNLYVDIVYNPKLMLMFVGIMFAVLLLTLISPMRKIKKMNVVNEIKYE